MPVICNLVIMAISICFWANYTDNKPKLNRKSENAVDSDRVLKFLYDCDTNHIESVVQASMKDTSYEVKVSFDRFLVMPKNRPGPARSGHINFVIRG